MQLTHLKGLFLSIILLSIYACEEPEQQGPPPIMDIPVVTVETKDIPLYEEFVGQTYGAKDIAIRARVEGFLETIQFDEGFPVRKGQLLYTIDPQPFEANVAEAASKVAEAKTILVKAEADLNRIRPLAEMNAVSESDLDAAEAQYGAAMASVEAAQASQRLAEINLSYTQIYSPISGIIGKTEARVGDFVGREPNPVVLNVVSQIETILVRFYIPEAQYLEFFRNETQEERRDVPEQYKGLHLLLADGSVHKEIGKLDFAGRDIDPTTGTLLLQASFANPEKLIRPGQYAKIRAVVEYKKGAILVPQRCIMELQGQYSVFVVNKENKVERRQIEVGKTVDDFWLVKDGLEPGEQVVIDALQKVKGGVEVNPVATEFNSKHDNSNG